MKIVYSEHLKYRINMRGIPYKAPRRIVLTSPERYFDIATNYMIAIGDLNLSGSRKLVTVVYDIIDPDTTKIVTAQFITRAKILSRIKIRRWIKKEEQ